VRVGSQKYELMKIKDCSLEDLERIYRMNKEIYGDGCYPWFVLRQFFDCFGDLSKIALEDGEAIGFSVNGVSSHLHEGWILSLGVRPGYRQKGVGTRLLTESIKAFRRKGLKQVKLTVHRSNTAFNTYREMGFIIHGDYDNYYGDQQRRTVMKLAL